MQARRGLFMLGPRSRCLVPEPGRKLTCEQTVCMVPSVLYQGKEILRERKKTQNPECVCLLRGWGNLQEGCWKKHATSFERQERVQMSWYFAQMSVLFFFFFSDQLGGTPAWKIPHFCSCLMVCKSFISVGTAKRFCNSPNQKKKMEKEKKRLLILRTC